MGGYVEKEKGKHFPLSHLYFPYLSSPNSFIGDMT